MSLNPIRPWRNIERRKSRQIMVGKVPVGGDAPISVQTMTNTNGHDVKATLAQVIAAADAGADIVRISAPDQETTRALREICRESPVPIVADIHFHYKRAIEAAQNGAACLRINPGNIGSADRVREVVQAAKDYGCSIRIGVNEPLTGPFAASGTYVVNGAKIAATSSSTDSRSRPDSASSATAVAASAAENTPPAGE